MPSNWTLTLNDGRVWCVGACSIFGEPKEYPNGAKPARRGEIIIPVCQAEGLTAEEIGQRVLDLIPHARTCYAAHVASAYVGESNQKYQRSAPGDILESMVLEDLPLIEEHRDDELATPEVFDEAISFLYEMKARYEAAQLRKLHKVHPSRKAVSRNYNELFMTIGNRDGFHCGACGANKKLQIDHVIPVSVGGTSDIANLQLLCGSCNSKKGDKTIDYREAAA